jgi:molecular chaperone IbpA
MVGSTNMSYTCLIKEKNMTNLTLRSLDIPSLHKFAVGFDQVFDDLLRVSSNQQNNYPPYNIIKHNEDEFSIEIAAAGFKDGNINVTVEKNQLTVSGDKDATDSMESVEYLYRGISSRNFSRTWTLADHVEVDGAIMKNGILTVRLKRVVPEEMKPKSIAITYVS